MKKISMIAAFALVAGYSVYQSQQKEQMSDIALENVEALADGEVSENGYKCYSVYTPADWFHSDQVFIDCYTCTQKKGRNFDLMDRCNKNI